MRVGTKSLLVGSHQFIVHPLMVALGWRHCYGAFPRDPRVWVAFVVHDWGYWGKPNMDGDEGQDHPYLGGRIMHRLFDPGVRDTTDTRWFDFTIGHSRYFARRYQRRTSPLMRADRMATALLPRRLLVLLATLSGEGREYVRFHREATGLPIETIGQWAAHLQPDWRRRFGKAA